MAESPDPGPPSGPDLREGDEIEAAIAGLAHGGAGVARVRGLVIFVRGALPGDVVRARLVSRKRSFAEAEVTELLTPSPDRIAARCEHFGTCGGCQWMDLAYRAQLAAKEAQLADCLARIGRLDGFRMHPIVPSPRTFGYRNKMEFAFDGAGGGLIAGLHRAADPSIIEPIVECHLQEPLANRILVATVAACREAGLSGLRDGAFRGPRGGGTGGAGAGVLAGAPSGVEEPASTERAGLLRRLIVRKGSDGAFLLVFEIRGGRFPEGPALAAALRERFPEISGVVAMGSRDDGSPREAVVLAGTGVLLEETGGLAMRVTAGAFLQVNPLQAAQLYDRVEGWADPDPDDEVLDLFCGAGPITLRLGRRVRHATGVESSREAVRCAEENARAGGLANCRFLRADAPHAALEMARSGRAFDVVVFNPPRAGLTRDLARAAGQLTRRRAIYVSCDPATLARDLSWLREGGWIATDVAPFDMFPHTWHVETVARLERAS